MEKIQIFIEEMILACGITGDTVGMISHALLVIIAILLAALAGILCRKLVVPLLLKLTKRTEVKWDDVIFSEKVLVSACRSTSPLSSEEALETVGKRLHRLLTANGYQLLRLVEIEGCIAAHLNVHQHIGLHQLGHQQ